MTERKATAKAKTKADSRPCGARPCSFFFGGIVPGVRLRSLAAASERRLLLGYSRAVPTGRFLPALVRGRGWGAGRETRATAGLETGGTLRLGHPGSRWPGEKQIPGGNDRKKCKSKSNRRSFAPLRRFPEGMTERNARATTKARADSRPCGARPCSFFLGGLAQECALVRSLRRANVGCSWAILARSLRDAACLTSIRGLAGGAGRETRATAGLETGGTLRLGHTGSGSRGRKADSRRE